MAFWSNKRMKQTKEQIFEHCHSGTIEKKFLEIWMFVRKKEPTSTQHIYTSKIQKKKKLALDICKHHSAAVFYKCQKYRTNEYVTLLFYGIKMTKVLFAICAVNSEQRTAHIHNKSHRKPHTHTYDHIEQFTLWLIFE